MVFKFELNGIVSMLTWFLFLLQNFQERCVKQTLSNGFSLHQDKKEKLGEEDPAELQILGTGKQQALLAMCIRQIIV